MNPGRLEKLLRDIDEKLQRRSTGSNVHDLANVRGSVQLLAEALSLDERSESCQRAAGEVYREVGRFLSILGEALSDGRIEPEEVEGCADAIAAVSLALDVFLSTARNSH